MFSKQGVYAPAGLFSSGHIIALCLCLLLILVVAILTKNISKQRLINILKFFAIVFVVLELFKIFWSLYVGRTWPDAWLPLYFCSLFIYALLMVWSNNQEIRDLGLSFIGFAGTIAGLVFLVFPTTSFNTFPIFHFQCLYSMLYHSVMMYSGLMVLKLKLVKYNKYYYKKYFMFCLIFMLLALTANINLGCNMMFISNPGVIPIRALGAIYSFSSALYTVILVSAHLILPYVVRSINICYNYLKNKRKNKSITLEDEELINKEL